MIASVFKFRFGSLVKKYRERAGLTQMDVARLVYRDEEKSSRVSDVERGRHTPQASTIADYREALKIPEHEIERLKEADSVTTEAAELHRFQEKFESCTLETSFDALISGEGIITLAMGYGYYENLHGAYVAAQLEYVRFLKYTQNNDHSEALKHRELGEALLDTLKKRVSSIPDCSLLGERKHRVTAGQLGSDRKIIETVTLSSASSILNQVIAKAREWEWLQQEALSLGRQGEVDRGREAFFASARALGSIVDLYRTHQHVFDADARRKIDDLLNLIDSGDEDGTMLLIRAVQAIHHELETVVQTLRSKVRKADSP